MSYSFTIALLLLNNPAPPAGDNGGPPQCEARCADGSVVRVALLQPYLVVVTKYGRLTVPAGEVRRLEVGLHYPDGVEARVKELVGQLGDKSHKTREEATAALAGLGEYAYGAVVAATKSKDLEVAERAEKVAALIRDKVPAEVLARDPDDKVHTARMVVVGRLEVAALKVRSADFGEAEIKLCRLRDLRRVDVTDGRVVTVDAARHGSPGTAWLDTGVDVAPGARLMLTAEGAVDLWPAGPGQYTCGPAGYQNGPADNGGRLPGSLLGRVGEAGPWFVVGEKWSGESAAGGRLYLLITSSAWNNVIAGSYKVTIR